MRTLSHSFHFLVIVVLLEISGCATTPVRQHPEFAAAKRVPHVVAVLPPDVEFTHIVFTGENERDAQKEQVIGAEIYSTVQTSLEQRGYTVRMDLLQRINEGDKQLNFEYEQLKSAYREASKELYQKGVVPVEDSTKFKVSIGPVANIFSIASGADALILARYSGFDKSGGQMTKEVVAGALVSLLTGVARVPAKTGGRIEIAVIDGASGDILWTNVHAATAGPASLFQAAVATLPAASYATSDEAHAVAQKMR